MHLRKPSPATAIALVALFFALGGTAIAAHHYLITSTKQIKPSVLKKLKVPGASGVRGANGANGAAGPQGPQGPQGAQGPQGPGAVTLTFDEKASPAPEGHHLGTLLGDTFSASCGEVKGGEAKLTVLFQTSDGSWDTDFTSVNTEGEARSSRIVVAAPTLKEPLPLLTLAAEGGKSEGDVFTFLQLGPQKGNMVWSAFVQTSTVPHTCHFAVQGYPSA